MPNVIKKEIFDDILVHLGNLQKLCKIRCPNNPLRGPLYYRCLLVDDSGNIVLNPEYQVSQSSDIHNHQSIPLPEADGFIFMDLVKKGLFQRHSRINYQGVCTVIPEVLFVLSIYIQQGDLGIKRVTGWGNNEYGTTPLEYQWQIWDIVKRQCMRDPGKIRYIWKPIHHVF